MPAKILYKPVSFLWNRVVLASVRRILGSENLSPYQAFLLSGGGKTLYENFNFSSSADPILVLGGFQGSSAQSWQFKTQRLVHVVEPLRRYIVAIEALSNSRLILHPFAVGAINERRSIALDSDASGQFAISDRVVEVDFKDVAEFLGDIGENFCLLECNIEGGEYEVFERLIQANALKKFEYIQVQFHKVGEDFELRRAQIRKCLSSTHDLEFSFDWVWERWVKKSNQVH